MGNRFKDWEHVLKVAGLFVVAIVVFAILKTFSVPGDFGTYGHFRTGAISDNTRKALVYAGQTACVDCHAEVVETRKEHHHAAVTCEACHGPLASHASDPIKVRAQKPDGRTLCLTCHTTNVAKPQSFPQINPQEHAPEGSCLDCHDPHNPELE
jgi:predicted CXXCH cytochrome family protein